MDANQIRRLRPQLRQYLKQFDDCFARQDTRAYLAVYVEGQLSDLPAKSCEPIAPGVEGLVGRGRCRVWWPAARPDGYERPKSQIVSEESAV